MKENKMMVKTADAVSVYNVLKGLKISKLKKEDQFTVLRAARALKHIATGFEDFVKDAQERLKPDGFDKMEKKRELFAALPDSEKMELNRFYLSYQKDVDDCVRPELESDKEVDSFAPLSEEALSCIASANENLDVQTLILIEDVCGR